jgi:glutaredoxin
VAVPHNLNRSIVEEVNKTKQVRNMGRITIFASDGCPHCKRVKVAFCARGIPFTEVSVTKYPERRQDMLALSDRVSTPQVFFNTRHVGGADDTVALLQVWDKEKKKFPTAYDRYMDEIGTRADPTNPRLAVPENDPVEPELSPPRGEERLSVSLPCGKKIGVVEMTELLKRLLPSGDNIRSRRKHTMSFTGSEGVAALSREFGISKERAVDMGRQLQKKMILHSVADNGPFGDSDHIFRLQYYSSPSILNSYRIWTEKADPNPMRLLNTLLTSMNKLEAKVTDNRGQIDYAKVVTLPDYTLFEEAVCELQKVDMKSMDDQTKTVRRGISVSPVLMITLVLFPDTLLRPLHITGIWNQPLQPHDKICLH